MEIIKPPKDAEGREIPRNTWAMYDANGKKLHITSFTYKCDTTGFWSQWKVFSPDIRGEKDGMLPAESLYLTPPDSLERLEDDLDSCSASTRYAPCTYFSNSTGDCAKCSADPNKQCIDQMVKHIALRIRRLRSESR